MQQQETIGRHDLVLLFDVRNGNPNGDPDAGGIPRVNPLNGHGIVTDVCIKRKIRNFVQLDKGFEPPYDIYVREKSVLGAAHFKICEELGIDAGASAVREIAPEIAEAIGMTELPEGVEVIEDGDARRLVVASTADVAAVKRYVKESGLDKAAARAVADTLKEARPRKLSRDESERGCEAMCRRYFDIRAFGAVLSLKSAPNYGQVRGPVQVTFAESLDPITPVETTVTRCAVTTEAESADQGGENRTMGRRTIVPYALYRAHVFVSGPFAARTGFGQADLDLVLRALAGMFEHDHAAARGEMNVRALCGFRHASPMGNAPSGTLLERIKATRAQDRPCPASFADYRIETDTGNLPEGVEFIRVV